MADDGGRDGQEGASGREEPAGFSWFRDAGSFENAATLVFIGAAAILFLSALFLISLSLFSPESLGSPRADSGTAMNTVFRVLGMIAVIFVSSGLFVLVARTGLPQIGRALGELLSLEKVGLAAFIIAAIAVIAACILMVASSLFGDVASGGVFVVRAVEILLSLAAAAIVVAIITREKTESFVVIIGMLALLAFIIPTNDIIRFSLLFTDSDRNYSDFYVQNPTTKTGVNAQAEEIAEVAVRVMDTRTGSGRFSTDEAAMERLQDELAKHLIGQIAFDVRRRGAMHLLEAVCANQEDKLIFQFGKQERFQNHLSHLRSEGLITFPYEDKTSIKVTDFGQRVLRAEREGADCHDLRPRNVIAADTTISLEEGDATLGRVTTLEIPGYEARSVPLNVPGSGAEVRYFELLANGRGVNVDPVLEVRGPRGVTLARSDDDGGGLDARLAVRLSRGETYSIYIENIGATGPVELSIRELDEKQYRQILEGLGYGSGSAGFQNFFDPISGQWLWPQPPAAVRTVSVPRDGSDFALGRAGWLQLELEAGSYVIGARARTEAGEVIDTVAHLIAPAGPAFGTTDSGLRILSEGDDGGWTPGELDGDANDLDPKIIQENLPAGRYFLFVAPFDPAGGGAPPRNEFFPPDATVGVRIERLEARP